LPDELDVYFNEIISKYYLILKVNGSLDKVLNIDQEDIDCNANKK